MEVRSSTNGKIRAHSTHASLWDEIVDDHNKKRSELDEYVKKKRNKNNEATLDNLPVVIYLNETIFPILNQALIDMLIRVKEENSFYRPKSAFNGIDFLSECLYNRNPKYPDRSSNWTYIFDMDWVQEFLKSNPRPYYPFSLIWTRDYATLKIQSYLRGYWVRRRPDVQEVRSFWKDYKLDKINKNQQINLPSDV
ncbi:IQ domain-containing protein K-like [Rhynchophorus ferrugineus]|uniref:IQ domain-containing protein K-like n=1 Tax=Rhynchophorus ferrugineus TaxID=354439 RepID=UPI003FCDDF2E